MKIVKNQKSFETILKKSEENKEMQKEIKRKIMPIKKQEKLTLGGKGGARIPAQPHTFQNLLLRDTYAVLTRCLRKKITKTWMTKFHR